MLCAAIGIVVAVLARVLFVRAGVDPYLAPRALVYPRPYEIALAKSRASLALTRKEVSGLRNGVSSADASVARAAAQLNASAADVVRREVDPVAADAEIARLQAQRVASDAALQRA